MQEYEANDCPTHVSATPASEDDVESIGNSMQTPLNMNGNTNGANLGSTTERHNNSEVIRLASQELKKECHS